MVVCGFSVHLRKCSEEAPRVCGHWRGRGRECVELGALVCVRCFMLMEIVKLSLGLAQRWTAGWIQD